VQKASGDAAVAFRLAHHPALDLRNPDSEKQSFANQGNQESRLRSKTRRSLHAGAVPNEVRWKNLLRRLKFRCLPEIRS
jgi:hypothetical protein